MKKSIFITLIAISLTLTFNACNNTTPAASATDSKISDKQEYTCSMHPEVLTDKPGNCPKCGMALIKKENSDTAKTIPAADTSKMK